MDLKPCPFCGGKAEFNSYEMTTDCGEAIIKFILCCSKCGSRTNNDCGSVHISLLKDGSMWFYNNDVDKAIESWNRRNNNGST